MEDCECNLSRFDVLAGNRHTIPAYLSQQTIQTNLALSIIRQQKDTMHANNLKVSIFVSENPRNDSHFHDIGLKKFNCWSCFFHTYSQYRAKHRSSAWLEIWKVAFSVPNKQRMESNPWRLELLLVFSLKRPLIMTTKLPS